MGNTCLKKVNNLYYKLPITEKCPQCKKKRYVSQQETAFLISTRGCRICRLKNKYYFYKNNEVTITSVSY